MLKWGHGPAPGLACGTPESRGPGENLAPALSPRVRSPQERGIRLHASAPIQCTSLLPPRGSDPSHQVTALACLGSPSLQPIYTGHPSFLTLPGACHSPTPQLEPSVAPHCLLQQVSPVLLNHTACGGQLSLNDILDSRSRQAVSQEGRGPGCWVPPVPQCLAQTRHIDDGFKL